MVSPRRGSVVAPDMSIVVSQKIRAQEFGREIPAEARDVLVRAARVCLATPLASQGLPAGTRLLKAYATSSHGPRRIVYLLAVDEGDLFLLFYRDKNDPVGENVSPKNPAFQKQLKKHLRLLREDIEANRFEVLEVQGA
jgi:hypothetical protein